MDAMTTDYPHPGDLDDEDDPDHDPDDTEPPDWPTDDEPDDPEDIEEKEDYYHGTDYTPGNIIDPSDRPTRGHHPYH